MASKGYKVPDEIRSIAWATGMAALVSSVVLKSWMITVLCVVGGVLWAVLPKQLGRVQWSTLLKQKPKKSKQHVLKTEEIKELHLDETLRTGKSPKPDTTPDQSQANASTKSGTFNLTDRYVSESKLDYPSMEPSYVTSSIGSTLDGNFGLPVGSNWSIFGSNLGYGAGTSRQFGGGMPAGGWGGTADSCYSAASGFGLQTGFGSQSFVGGGGNASMSMFGDAQNNGAEEDNWPVWKPRPTDAQDLQLPVDTGMRGLTSFVPSQSVSSAGPTYEFAR